MPKDLPFRACPGRSALAWRSLSEPPCEPGSALLPALPASRLVAGIWIASLVLLAHSMHSFPSCGMASCRKGQAAAARRAPAPRLALVRLEKRGGRGAASPLAPQSG